MAVESRREGATVVLVEDDHAVAQTMSDALDSSGYQVWRAAKGAAAPGPPGDTRPDVVRLYFVLPTGGGLAESRHAARRAVVSNANRVSISFGSGQPSRSGGLASGAGRSGLGISGCEWGSND